MRTKRSGLSLLCAALLGAVGLGAQAATASATIFNVHIEVIDLKLDDGVDAKVEFTDSALAVEIFANASANNWATDDWHHDYAALGSAIGPFSASKNGATSNASVLAGDSFVVGSGPAASASAGASDAGRAAYASGSTLTSAFTLSPYAKLVLSAETRGVDATAGAGEYAHGYAEVALSAGDQDSYSASSIEIDRRPGGVTAPPNLNAQIVASIVNDSPEAVYGYAYADAGVNVVAAVPEPAAMTLMMTGLLFVAGLAARRAADRGCARRR